MDQGTIASLPLGLIAFAAIVVFAGGVTAGWLAARARTRRRAARLARDRLQPINGLLNALPLPVLVADAEARLTARNASAAQLLQELGPGGDLPLTVDAAIGRVTRSGIAETLELPLPGHPARRLQVSISPLTTGAPAPEALVLFSDPNAGSGRAEVYQRLINTIAHELRTPLTAIMGHVDILNSCRIDEEALWRRSLGFVAGEAERLARLVEDLLSLSRLDRVPVHIQPVNVRAAAEEALSALFESAGREKVSLVLQAPPELPRALADPDRIRQVFLNLLDNAIKYAPASTVTVRLTPEAEAVKVEVGDTGPGISATDLPRIFEPLYRGERAASGSRGSGLGLTIVRTILDQHNAPISTHSFPGQGTTFAFALPIARSVEAA
jgi:two-component system phosphate regulon sensor histidine kinase PhoR